MNSQPIPLPSDSLSQLAAELSRRCGLHFVSVYVGPDQRFLFLTVEVPAGLSMAQSHERIALLEIALLQALPQVNEIRAHFSHQAMGQLGRISKSSALD